jgi:hypothetical protein
MARRGSGLPPTSSSGEEPDYLDRAIKFKERIVASNVIDSAAKLSSAEAARAETGGGAAAAPKPPVEVTGKLNLGEFNFQEAAQTANKQLQGLVEKQQDEIKQSGQLNLALRDQIQEKQNEILKLTFGAQIDALNTALSRALEGADKPSISQQIKEAQEVAKLLGMNMPQAGVPGATSPELAIKLKELEFNNLQTLEKMKDDREDRKRDWDLKLRQMDRDEEAAKANLERQASRDQFFFRFPQAIGGAIAQAVMDKGKGGAGVAGAGVKAAAQPPPKGAPPAQPPQQRQPYHLEMAPGEGGEMDCPNCGETIGLGPTARSAVCPNCGTQYPIRRTAQAETPPGAPPQTPAPET